MKCLICNATFSDDVVRLHYQVYHSINKNIYLFRELFSPDNLSKRCDECKLEFKNCRLKKKNHNFLLHYNQLRGSRNQQLPFNGLRCGAIFYYYINFYQDNYDKKIVKDFSNSVYERFVSGKDFKIQGYVEIINYQQTEIVNLENTRVWLTNVFKGTS